MTLPRPSLFPTSVPCPSHLIPTNDLTCLDQVSENVLLKVIEWCTQHRHDPPSSAEDDDSRRKTTDIEEWDQKFMQVDQEMLFEIILVRIPSFLTLSLLTYF